MKRPPDAKEVEADVTPIIRQPELQVYVKDFGTNEHDHARRLYERLGFKIIDRRGDELIMLKELR